MRGWVARLQSRCLGANLKLKCSTDSSSILTRSKLSIPTINQSIICLNKDIYLLCGVFEGLHLFLRLVEVSDSAEEGFGR